MPTPVEAYAQVAAEHGGVDSNDTEAVQKWSAETVPTLPPERLEAVLEDLLSREGDSTDRSLRPSYPRAAPLPGLVAPAKARDDAAGRGLGEVGIEVLPRDVAALGQPLPVVAPADDPPPSGTAFSSRRA